MAASEARQVNFIHACDDTQVTPGVLGCELNDVGEFPAKTNDISVVRLSMEPNSAFEPHFHPHNHVLVVLEGDGQITYSPAVGAQATTNPFSKGDVFNVPGLQAHAVSAGAAGVTLLVITSPAMSLKDPKRMVSLDGHEIAPTDLT